MAKELKNTIAARATALSALAGLLLAATASPAQAYTLYFKPQSFQIEEDIRFIRAELAFATTYFSPDIGADAPEMHIVTPDGETAGAASLEVAGGASQVGFNAWQEGTYLLSTGQRYGRVVEMVFDGERWRPIAEGEVLEPEAETTTLQTVAVAESYVTRGAPSEDVLDDGAGRLTIRPMQNPTTVSMAGGLQLALAFDGAAFANAPLVVNKAGETDTNFDRVFVTDEQGVAMLTFDAPGVYIATIRHRADAPEGADAAVQSYTTSLTFEVGG